MLVNENNPPSRVVSDEGSTAVSAAGGCCVADMDDPENKGAVAVS